MFIHSGVVCAGSMLSNAVLHGIVGDKMKTQLALVYAFGTTLHSLGPDSVITEYGLQAVIGHMESTYNGSVFYYTLQIRA